MTHPPPKIQSQSQTHTDIQTSQHPTPNLLQYTRTQPYFCWLEGLITFLGSQKSIQSDKQKWRYDPSTAIIQLHWHSIFKSIHPSVYLQYPLFKYHIVHLAILLHSWAHRDQYILLWPKEMCTTFYRGTQMKWSGRNVIQDYTLHHPQPIQQPPTTNVQSCKVNTKCSDKKCTKVLLRNSRAMIPYGNHTSTGL